MAAGSLPAPGTEYGPCVEACEHRDCAATRRMLEAPCRICGEPIGHERRFYDETDRDTAPAQLVLVHAVCLWQQDGVA